MCIGTRVHTSGCKGTSGQTVAVFLNHAPPHPLKEGLSLNPANPSSLDNRFHAGSPIFNLPSSWNYRRVTVSALCWHLCGCWDLKKSALCSVAHPSHGTISPVSPCFLIAFSYSHLPSPAVNEPDEEAMVKTWRIFTGSSWRVTPAPRDLKPCSVAAVDTHEYVHKLTLTSPQK